MKALIYCRVSSERQVKEGSGIESQEQRCRNRANEKGWTVSKVFPDEGVSGKLFERPAMKALLTHIDNHPTEQFVVIFDDLSRFARDVEVHIRLKMEFEKRGVKRECLNFGFDESEESEYAELILAAGNQYQRKQNRRQVIQKMKARVESGYWPFCLPPGLVNQKHPMHGKIAFPDEPLASIFKTAIEGYRDRILLRQQDVVSYIQQQYKAKNINRKISIHGVQLLLTEILYTGYIEYPKWGIARRKAQFNGFITLETYEEVQRILNDRTKPKIRRDTNPEFPLRGLIVCSLCRKPLTASFNTGHSGQRYPNYFCKKPGCPLQNKVIHRCDLEENFVSLLETVQIEQSIIDLAKAVLSDAWDKHEANQNEAKHAQEHRLRSINEQIETVTSRLRQTTNNKLISLYEEELLKLHDEKDNLETTHAPLQYTEQQFGTAIEKVCSVLKNPAMTWQSGTLYDKFAVYFMHFDQKPVYDRERGFGTAPLAQSVELIRSLGSEKIPSVEMPGNEPGSEGVHQKLLQA